MNLQSLTIIFVIIFLPIILISTYYIQREVDTITMQTSYDTKLIDATTDAVSAFEINTANEDLSSSADSLRSIIEASNNVFTTTMATNLGMSGATQSKILPYIPAIVYTLYDGYYIYSPTKQPKVLTDPDGVYVKVGDVGVKKNPLGGYLYDYNSVKDASDKSELDEGEYKDNDYGKILYFGLGTEGKIGDDEIACVTNPDDAYQTTSYILKSFIPYSMQYEWGSNNVTINYTLDNYITVYGTIDGIYYSKSGYLIDYTRIKEINIDIDKYSIEELEELVKDKDDISLKVDGQKISSTNDNSAISEHYTNEKISDNKSAVAYYLKAYKFSEWVYENLSDINPSKHISHNLKDLQDGFSIKQNGVNLENEAKLFWKYTEESIFEESGIGDIENSNSNFYEHKRKVIKNSIQYALNQAMATYNQGQGDEYYQMPILSEPEWDKLLSNVSVLAFMQGLPCGLKTYSNYALVTSTNNEIMANLEDIFYIPIQNSSDGVKTSNDDDKAVDLDTACRIDCKKLFAEINNSDIYFQSFPSREIKYDKRYNPNTRKYEYDHVCNSCYDCIINSNYDKANYLDSPYKDVFEKAKLIAIGKIRNNTYKSSAVNINYGLSLENFDNKTFNDITLDSDKINKCYEIQVTIDGSGISEQKTGEMYIGNDRVTYKTGKNQVKPQTLVFKNSDSWDSLTIGVTNGDIKILSITYKYK
ncbi:MAG: hypothetical protein J6J60_04875 [Clostridia bacterium]|nr:hypothetical protein [Clostridia bacterium]